MDAMTRPPEQQTLPADGMAPPPEPNIPEVRDAIYNWLDRKVNQKRAADETRVAHMSMLALLAEHKLEWHPYLDPYTQKKRRVWVAKEPKAKTTGVPKPPKEPRAKRGRRGRQAREADAEIVDDKIEVRRVPRKSVQAEVDPFATIRERMDAKGQTITVTRGKGKRGK